MTDENQTDSGRRFPPIDLPPDPPSEAPPPDVVEWVRAHAVPAGPEDAPPDAAEAEAIGRVIEGARVIGFGEIGHGPHEPIAYRNRLVRFLVEHHGLTAIVLESPLAESKRVNDYVLGGPGEAEAITRKNLGYTFGEFQANLDLVRWLREYNADRSHRPVKVYGIDASTMGMSHQSPSGGYGTILHDLASYLERTVPDASRGVRDELAQFAGRFTPADYPSYTDQERDRLEPLLRSTEELFAAHSAAMIAASSEDEYAWYARIAYDARRLPAFFVLWTPEVLATGLSTQGDWISDTITLLNLRDGLMAEHTLWALDREGPEGRVLLFQANGHVTATTMVGSIMRLFPRQPENTGSVLRRTLGDAYRVIVTASSHGRSPDDPTTGSVDRAFAAAGLSRAFLDIREAGPSGWWGQRQTLGHGDARIDDVVPAEAWDGILHFDHITSEPGLVPGQ